MISERFNKLGLGWAELIGLATTFLLVTGISYSYGYYAFGLNAEWIINLLTTKELLITNIRFGAYIFASLMFLTSIVEQGTKKDLVLDFICGVVGLLVLLVVSYELDSEWPDILTILLTLVAVFLLITVPKKFKFYPTLTLIFIIPFCNGLTAYVKKIKSDLPIVIVKEEEKQWQLFDTYSDQAVIIDSIKKEKNIRVVPISDLENIRVR